MRTKIVCMRRLLACVRFARAEFFVGVNIARFDKRHFCKRRAKQLVNKYRKQCNVGNDYTHFAKLHRFECHTQRNARLR